MLLQIEVLKVIYENFRQHNENFDVFLYIKLDFFPNIYKNLRPLFLLVFRYVCLILFIFFANFLSNSQLIYSF